MSTEEPEETVIGHHTGNIQHLEYGRRTFNGRYYCSNCKRPKSPLHCYVEPNGMPVINCTDKRCQCPCRRNYDCGNCGRLHPYDKQCDYKEPSSLPRHDEEIEKINSEFRKLQEKRSIKIKEEDAN
jgi:hypothetical protein